MDAAHYLGVYDIDLIYSWTPRQYQNLLKGARLKEIDEYEFASTTAIFNAVAQNTSRKNLKPKDIFDADKMRNQILSVEGKKEPEKYLGFYNRAKAAMKNYRPQNGKKGG